MQFWIKLRKRLEMKITESLLIRNYLKTLTFKNKNSLNLEDDIFYDSKTKIILSTDTYEENIHFLKYFIEGFNFL